MLNARMLDAAVPVHWDTVPLKEQIFVLQSVLEVAGYVLMLARSCARSKVYNISPEKPGVSDPAAYILEGGKSERNR